MTCPLHTKCPQFLRTAERRPFASRLLASEVEDKARCDGRTAGAEIGLEAVARRIFDEESSDVLHAHFCTDAGHGAEDAAHVARRLHAVALGVGVVIFVYPLVRENGSAWRQRLLIPCSRFPE